MNAQTHTLPNEMTLYTNDCPTDFTALADGSTFRAPLDILDPLPCGNIRRRRDPLAFEELRQQVAAARGVTQAITVRINPDDHSRLQIIAGYGRYDVSVENNYETIPVVFKIANLAEAMAMMTSENTARESLSVADEAVMAQRMSIECGGDIFVAAKALGWTQKMFKSRLLLNQCSERVLDAVFEHPHLLAYAEILSNFTEEKQNATIVKIIDEGWSLEETKQRAGVAVRFLKDAIFDTADCHECPHNTTDQADLFQNTVGSSKCANLVCYKEKTDVVIQERRKAIEYERGVTLIASESPPSLRKTLTASLVGEEQLSNGCNACASCVVVIDDSINKTAGSLTENQCIDLVCFDKMVNAEKKRKKSIVDKKTTPKASAVKSTSVKTTAAKSTAPAAPAEAKFIDKAIVNKMPNGVIDDSKKMIREVASDHFGNDFRFHDALAVASLIWNSGFHRENECEVFLGESKGASSFLTILNHVYLLEMEQIVELKKLTSAFVMRDRHKDCHQHGDIEDLMIGMLSEQKRGTEEAIARWSPSEALLNKYQKGGIELLCKDSGFTEYFDEKHGQGAFLSLTKKSKKGFIQAIVADTNFSWDAFAPSHYIDLLKTK